MSVKTISQFNKKVRKSLKFDKEVCKSPKIQQKVPKYSKIESWQEFLASGKDTSTKVVLARKIKKQGRSSTPAEDSSICDNVTQSLFYFGTHRKVLDTCDL